MHQTKRHHGKPCRETDPAILGRVLAREAKDEEPARGDDERGKHGRQPALRFRQPAARTLDLLLQLSIGEEIRVESAQAGPDDASNVDQPDVGAPEVRRCRHELGPDRGDGDDAADEACVVKHNDPCAWQPQRLPGSEEIAHDAAVVVGETQGPSEGEGSIV